MVLDGDALLFAPKFSPCNVTIMGAPKIKGTGHATVTGKKVCILGDEHRVRLTATYISPGFPTPGQGTVTILRLASDQIAKPHKSKMSMLLKGKWFDALFTPTTPAMSTSVPPAPAPLVPCKGKGQFITTQIFTTAG
ncbi:MAG: hypothetical protein JKY31_04015 [Rhodobacteraceae bacterium]|nr:hypothetical protein [Paracoccaceae bacterium]